MARDEFSTPPSLLSKPGRMAGPPTPPLLGLWRTWSQAGAQHAEYMAKAEFPTPPWLLSKLGRMAGPPSLLLGLWRAWSHAGPLSPRMRCRASRQSHLAQRDPTSCRPQRHSEGGLGRSGRYHWACLPAWCGNRRRCGWWSYGMSTTFAPLPSADTDHSDSTDPADVRLAACAAVVCVAHSADELP